MYTLKTKLQKTPPTCKCDIYTIVYKQVPFDNRYFFIKVDNELVAKISRCVNDQHNIVEKLVIPHYNSGFISNFHTHINNFMDRCDGYDKYLDR